MRFIVLREVYGLEHIEEVTAHFITAESRMDAQVKFLNWRFENFGQEELIGMDWDEALGPEDEIVHLIEIPETDKVVKVWSYDER